MTAGVLALFNMHTNVDACNCAQGLYGHHNRVCAESWLWKKNPLPHRGIKPVSVLHLAFQSAALPTELSHPLLPYTAHRNHWATILYSPYPFPRGEGGSGWPLWKEPGLFSWGMLKKNDEICVLQSIYRPVQMVLLRGGHRPDPPPQQLVTTLQSVLCALALY